MLLKVLLKFQMLQEAGTASFIVFKTKFISIGKKLIEKLPHSCKRKRNKINLNKWKFSNCKKESIGKEFGKLRKDLNKF